MLARNARVAGTFPGAGIAHSVPLTARVYTSVSAADAHESGVCDRGTVLCVATNQARPRRRGRHAAGKKGAIVSKGPVSQTAAEPDPHGRFRLPAAVARLRPHHRRRVWIATFVFLALAAAIGALTYLTYRAEASRTRHAISGELTSVARLKADDVSGWLAERKADGRAVSVNPMAQLGIEQLAAGHPGAAWHQGALPLLDAIRANHSYLGVLVYDLRGRLLTSLGSPAARLGDPARAAIRTALATDAVQITDLYLDRERRPQMDVVAPLRIQTAAGRKDVGAVVFDIDPSTLLYPLIDRWPGAETSAEILLVRRQGNSVVFLNELRQRRDAALTYALPLGADQAAGIAAQGGAGVTEGINYTGVPVLLAYRSIPTTDWHIAVEVNQSEVYAPVRADAVEFSIIGLASVLAAGLLVVLLGRRRETALLRREADGVRERAALARHYEYLTRNAGDAIVLLDGDRRIVEANERAEEVSGYTREELLSKRLNSLVPDQALAAQDERWRSIVDGQRSLYEGAGVRKDGTRFSLESSMAAIRIDDATYVQVVMRDISARVKTDEALRSSNNRLHMLFEAGRALNGTLDLPGIRDIIHQAITGVVDCDGLFISDYDTKARLITCAAAWTDGRRLDAAAFPPIPLEPEGQGTQSRVIRSGQSLVLNDYDKEAQAAQTRYFVDDQTGELVDDVPEECRSTRSGIVVPMQVEGRVAGVIQVLSGRPDAFSDSDLSFVEALAVHAASATENARLFARLQEELAERRRAEGDARAAEARYRTLFEQAPDGILVVDAGTLGMLEFNDLACTDLGYSRDEFSHLNVRDYLVDFDEEWLSDVLRRVSLSEKAVTVEMRHRTRDGELRDRLVSLQMIYYSGVPAYLAIYRDITEQTRNREQILRLTHLYGALSAANEAIARVKDLRALYQLVCRIAVDDAGLAMAWVGELDDEGRLQPIASWGARAEYLDGLKITRGEPLSLDPTRVAIGEGAPDACNDVENDERMSPWRDEHLAAGYRSTAAVPLFGGGHVTGALTMYAAEADFFSYDMMELLGRLGGDLSLAAEAAALEEQRAAAAAEVRRLNEELERRVRDRTAELEKANRELAASNRELESFSYSVSHDLRAPLRAIDGFSMAVLEDYASELPEGAAGYLHRVRAAAQRMGWLIDALLQLTRVGRAEMRSEEVDLSAMAREIVAALQEAEPARQVDVTIQDDVHAVGDPHLLRVVLQNLLDNAWKFTSTREHATVRFVAALEGEELVYRVGDDGAGFEGAYAHRLFAPFQRLHTVQQFPGNGVGLATVQRIIHRHGGRVWAFGRPDEGATFSFTVGPN